MSTELTLEIRATTSVAYVQAAVRAFVRAHRGASIDEWSLAIAASEAATNIAKFATRGTIRLRAIEGTPRVIEMCAEDDGPGVDDVNLAMKDGISEGIDLASQERRTHRRGLGTGLGAIARATDTLSIDRSPAGGTRLTARRTLRKR